MVRRMIATSRTLRASGPTWSKLAARGTTPWRLTLPKVGFNPTTPQRAEGMRMDPPVSVPNEAVAMQAATAAAEPPLEPPGLLCVSQGFNVGPKWTLLVVAP